MIDDVGRWPGVSCPLASARPIHMRMRVLRQDYNGSEPEVTARQWMNNIGREKRGQLWDVLVLVVVIVGDDMELCLLLLITKRKPRRRSRRSRRMFNV